MKAIDRLILFQKHVSKEIGGQNKFETYCGLSTGYLCNMSKQGSSITTDVILKVVGRFPDLNINWLMTGEGKMLLSEMDSINLNYKKAYEECLKRIEELENMIPSCKKTIL